MKACGIIVEYNPFHNGHMYHLQQARQQSNCDLLIAVMSPNFVQRGEPAICDKWSRARTALNYGADLVIELPTLHAVQSATYFANAAVELLALANVDTIVFGSECSDLSHLQLLASQLPRISLSDKSRSTVRQYEQEFGTLSPNDLLGINYIHAAQKYAIQTMCIQRTNNYHATQIDSAIASASAIRHHFLNGEDVSPYTVMSGEMKEAFTLNRFYPYLQTKLLIDEPKRMKELFLMDEGIESLLIDAVASCDTIDAFLDHCTNARYTRSRIQRTLIHYLLETSKSDANQHVLPAHLRILAFRPTARPWLRILRDQGRPVVSRFQDLPLFYQKMERKATALYTYGNLSLRKAFLQKEVEGPYYDDRDN